MKACVDIGGTKVAVALVRDGAEPTADTNVPPPPFAIRMAEPTVKTGAPSALATQILGLIDRTCAEVGVQRDDLRATGVSSCGPFVLRDGCVEVANPNICGGLAGAPRGIANAWTQIPLERPLRDALRHVRVANDAVAALQAEMRWGALRGATDCAYVTWSTGVGVGLCVDGRVLRGKNGNAGHAGHSFVVDGSADALCGCGNRGDVESLVAGSAFQRRFGRSARELLQAATGGDASALAATDVLCAEMGRLLYNLTATLDLQRISLGGAVFLHHHNLLLPRLQREVQRYFPALTEGVQLRVAGLGAQVGDYAALALVADEADAAGSASLTPA